MSAELDVERIAVAMIRVRGAHNPTADEIEDDEEVRPCAWCRLAAEQAVEAIQRAARLSSSVVTINDDGTADVAEAS